MFHRSIRSAFFSFMAVLFVTGCSSQPPAKSGESMLPNSPSTGGMDLASPTPAVDASATAATHTNNSSAMENEYSLTAGKANVLIIARLYARRGYPVFIEGSICRDPSSTVDFEDGLQNFAISDLVPTFDKTDYSLLFDPRFDHAPPRSNSPRLSAGSQTLGDILQSLATQGVITIHTTQLDLTQRISIPGELDLVGVLTLMHTRDFGAATPTGFINPILGGNIDPDQVERPSRPSRRPPRRR